MKCNTGIIIMCTFVHTKIYTRERISKPNADFCKVFVNLTISCERMIMKSVKELIKSFSF